MVMLNEIFVSFLECLFALVITGKSVLHAGYKVIDAWHLISKT